MSGEPRSLPAAIAEAQAAYRAHGVANERDCIAAAALRWLGEDAQTETMARAICVEMLRDPDDMVKPAPHSTTLFAPYPRWQNYVPMARAAIAAVSGTPDA